MSNQAPLGRVIKSSFIRLTITVARPLHFCHFSFECGMEISSFTVEMSSFPSSAVKPEDGGAGWPLWGRSTWVHLSTEGKTLFSFLRVCEGLTDRRKILLLQAVTSLSSVRSCWSCWNAQSCRSQETCYWWALPVSRAWSLLAARPLLDFLSEQSYFPFPCFQDFLILLFFFLTIFLLSPLYHLLSLNSVLSNSLH